MDDPSKRLLELKFKSNHSIKSNVFQMDCQDNTTYLIKMVGKIYYQESRRKPFKVYVINKTHILLKM